MKKGLFPSVDDQSLHTTSMLESKRRKILSLTPPPDIFLFNSEDGSQTRTELDLKIDMLSSRNEEPTSMYSPTLGLNGCDSGSRGSVSKSDNLNPDKKQLCDLDFFKLMSEDEEDNSESGMLNLFHNTRYFEMVHSSDKNMNDLTKDADSTAKKYDSAGSIPASDISSRKSILSKEPPLKFTLPKLQNSGTYSSSSNSSTVTRDKVNAKWKYFSA